MKFFLVNNFYFSIQEIFKISSVVFFITYVFTTTSIFEKVREIAYDKKEWLGELCSCPFCFSFWMCMVCFIVLRCPSFADFATVMFLSNLMTGTIKKLYE